MNNITPFGLHPTKRTCSSCQVTIVTRVERKATKKTHAIASLLCLCLCWPCIWIPYFMDSCRKAEHYCPNCNSFLGTFL